MAARAQRRDVEFHLGSFALEIGEPELGREADDGGVAEPSHAHIGEVDQATFDSIHFLAYSDIGPDPDTTS